ncbi:MAG: FtsX-like permease family protein, partial [Oscillospiraceae bacterium]
PSSVLIQTSNSTSYTNCYLTSAPGENLDKAGQVAVNMLSARHNNIGRNIYSATNMSTLVELLDAVINIFTLFISSVGAISLVVGGIGVMNIMLVSVTERTREIGIRKALGARTGTILKQFLTESVIICLIGGALGMVLGLTISYSVSLYMNVPIRLQFSTILVAIGFSSIIGIISGIYPARKAAKMPPIEALRRD